MSLSSFEKLLGVDFDTDTPISVVVKTYSPSRRTTANPGEKHTLIWDGLTKKDLQIEIFASFMNFSQIVALIRQETKKHSVNNFQCISNETWSYCDKRLRRRKRWH